MLGCKINKKLIRKRGIFRIVVVILLQDIPLQSIFLVGVSDDIVQLNVEETTRPAIHRESRRSWQEFCSKQQLATLGPSY